MKYLLITLLYFASFATAHATDWQVDPEKSRIAFTAFYGKDKVVGYFPNFTAHITFNPAQLEASRIEVTIPLKDVAVEDSDAKENLPEEEWFDVENYPEAIFSSENIESIGENRYLAHGTLTLKGISAPLDLSFTLALSEDGHTAHAEGKTSLSRLAYHIGEGEWEETDILADKVELRVEIQARAQRR